MAAAGCAAAALSLSYGVVPEDEPPLLPYPYGVVPEEDSEGDCGFSYAAACPRGVSFRRDLRKRNAVKFKLPTIISHTA